MDCSRSDRSIYQLEYPMDNPTQESSTVVQLKHDSDLV